MKPKKIFWKVFPVTLLTLLVLVVLAYALLYWLLPVYYRSYKEAQYQEKMAVAAEKLSSTNSPEEEMTILTEFAQQNQVNLALSDEEGNTLYSYYQDSSIVANWENDMAHMDISVEKTGESEGERVRSELWYEKDEAHYCLAVGIPLQPLSEAKRVIVQIYPVAGMVCVVFAFLVACLFSLFFVKPIRRISQITRNMSNMEVDAEIPIHTSDEIGTLSADINHLYKELKGTIDRLNEEIAKSSDLEDKKIEFLRMVSHELKNPLAAAMSLIDGILYEIPPYHMNQKQYLAECRIFLEKAVDLVKESLSLSRKEYQEEEAACDVSDIIRSIAGDYQIFLQLHQIRYAEQLPECLIFHTRKNLFRKALSNILSNAANYTCEKGSIKLYTESRDGIQQLVIENTCAPIPEETLEKMFAPFYSGGTSNSKSNGLGLYIVNQIFDILHISYKFLSTEDRNGMRFIIDIE